MELMNQTQKSINVNDINIREDLPNILEILLIDRTTSTIKRVKNIIWANDNYTSYGSKLYGARKQIKPELITGVMGHVIVPRALKPKKIKKSRTKINAEVYTPIWIVKKQNDEVNKGYQEDDIETYTKRTWLEITCGEAPYIASRYEMDTGEIIPLNQRVGFLDRKLKRINHEITDKAEWQRLVELAYKASYGFEWNGDSLLIARENLLYTYIDYYLDKWETAPIISLLKDIAEIVSYNLFQMDGLNYTIPFSEKKEKILDVQLSLLEEVPEEQWIIKPGKRVKIMNWQTNKVEFFDKGVK